MRYFSIEEADRMVPYLQRTFEGIRTRAAEIARLGHLLRKQGDRSRPFAPIPDDLAEGHRLLRVSRDRQVGKIQEALETLGEVGIHVKRGDGMVDFLSKRGDRQVLLCWQFGEPGIAHWHEIGDGMDGRQLISRPEAFEPHYLN